MMRFPVLSPAVWNGLALPNLLNVDFDPWMGDREHVFRLALSWGRASEHVLFTGMDDRARRLCLDKSGVWTWVEIPVYTSRSRFTLRDYEVVDAFYESWIQGRVPRRSA